VQQVLCPTGLPTRLPASFSASLATPSPCGLSVFSASHSPSCSAPITHYGIRSARFCAEPIPYRACGRWPETRNCNLFDEYRPQHPLLILPHRSALWLRRSSGLCVRLFSNLFFFFNVSRTLLNKRLFGFSFFFSFGTRVSSMHLTLLWMLNVLQ
jgi:hypothetical protein